MRQRTPPTRRYPRLAATAVSLAALILATVAPQALFPSPASALTIDNACAGTVTTAYSPGFTLTPQTVSYSSTAAVNCTGDPNVTSGGYTSAGQITINCGLSMPSFNSQTTITWNTTETSTMAISSLVGINAVGVLTITITGEVIAGKFLGDDYTSVLVAAPTSGNCLFGGVTQVQGTFVNEFSH